MELGGGEGFFYLIQKKKMVIEKVLEYFLCMDWNLQNRVKT